MQTLLSTLFCMLVASIAAYAQEASIPVDADGRLHQIDSVLEAKLGLFPEIPEFHEARIFQHDSATFTLQITCQEEGKMVQRRTPLTLPQLQAFRQRVADSIAACLPTIMLNQEGRAKMLVNTTIISSLYYGRALAIATGMEDERTMAATHIISGAVGCFLPDILTANRPVRNADGQMVTSGMLLGIGHGMAASMFFHGEGTSVETALGWSIPFSIAEGVAGYMISDGYQLSEGDVAMITNGGVLGLGVGIGMTHLAGFVDIGDEHAAGLLILGGSAGGLLLGNAMANAQTYTTGDASVVASTALLGGFTPLFFAELIDPDQNDTDGKLHIGGVMLGATAGMLLGGELVREKDFTPSQATSIGLGEIAGGLLGAGLAYLVVPESSSDDLAVYLGAGSIGAIGGFAIAYNRMAKEARTTTAEEHGFLYDFDISPSGLAALMSGSDIPENAVVPLVGFSCRW